MPLVIRVIEDLIQVLVVQYTRMQSRLASMQAMLHTSVDVSSSPRYMTCISYSHISQIEQIRRPIIAHALSLEVPRHTALAT